MIDGTDPAQNNQYRGMWNNVPNNLATAYNTPVGYVVEYERRPITPGVPDKKPEIPLPDPGQLSPRVRYWDQSANSWIKVDETNKNKINTNEKTIVIVHGWYDKADSDSGWTREMAQAAASQGVNVLAWDWSDKAKSTLFPDYKLDILFQGLRGADDAIRAGATLGYTLASDLDILQIEPGKLQLVGNSAGAAVVGTAADRLKELTSQKVARVTSLDAPSLRLWEVPEGALAILLGGTVWYAVQGPTQANALRYITDSNIGQVEVYYSDNRAALGFGRALSDTGEPNVFNGLVHQYQGLPEGIDHFNTSHWFSRCLQWAQTPEGRDPTVAGLNWSIASRDYPLAAGNFEESRDPNYCSAS